MNGGVPDFGGLKVTQDAEAAQQFGLRRVTLDDIKPRHLTFDRFGKIGSGGNSGFQAVNLVAQTGAAKIVLIGFDMSLAQGVHWHGRHPPGMNNPSGISLASWRDGLDAAAPKLAALGIEVLNVSDQSALTAYPKVTLKDALA